MIYAAGVWSADLTNGALADLKVLIISSAIVAMALGILACSQKIPLSIGLGRGLFLGGATLLCLNTLMAIIEERSEPLRLQDLVGSPITLQVVLGAIEAAALVVGILFSMHKMALPTYAGWGLLGVGAFLLAFDMALYFQKYRKERAQKNVFSPQEIYA